jgi:hypothetical protein
VALLKVGRDPAFRKDWEDSFGRKRFRQMFTGKEIFEAELKRN